MKPSSTARPRRSAPLEEGLVPDLRAAIDAQARGDAAGARARFARLLERRPDHPLILHYAGLNLHLLGEHEEGLTLLRRSTELAPTEAGFWRNLAGVLHARRLLDECARALERAHGLEPAHSGTLLQRARLELERGRWPAAADLFALLIASSAPSAERLQAHAGLAVALSAMGLYREAEESLKGALRLAPDDPEIWIQLGEVALSLGEYERARAALGEAARLAPDHEAPPTGLAAILLEEGRFEEARRALRVVLACHPHSLRAWTLLFTLKGHDEDSSRDLETALRLAADPTPAWDEDPHAGAFLIALGGALEERSAYEEAFRLYERGNRLRHRPGRYEAAAEARYDRALLLATGADFRRRHTPQEPPPPFTPVYIVGMPRSGTTLMEEMLAAHPALSPGGEMSSFHALLLRTLRLRHLGELPEALARADAETIVALRRASTDLLARTARGKPFVTDKMPANYLFLGLLRTLFPHLRILHMRRDPRDTCLSCYTTNFRFGHEFASNLTDLGTHYRCYETVVGFWREALPPSLFLDVDYETLVAEPEPTLRRVLAFLGLPWDPAVLAFHEVVRPVRTASVYQVRQPLNRRSVGRWRRFAPWLGPLDEALGLRTPLPPPFTLPEGFHA
jgi:tetratricopeptide (TPR) repeat protein